MMCCLRSRANVRNSRFARLVSTDNSCLSGGRDVANWSGLMGPLLSEGLANAYWPEQDRTARQTFERYGIDLAVRLGENVLRDYWPVFFRKVQGSPRSQMQGK